MSLDLFGQQLPWVALSLQQPIASLVAWGEKRRETRGWATRHRGPFAVHAGLQPYDDWGRFFLPGCAVDELIREAERLLETPLLPKQRVKIMRDRRVLSVVHQHGIVEMNDLPRGGVIATSSVVRVQPTEAVREAISEDEAAFGDYSDGRYAFELGEPRTLGEMIPCRGALNMFELPLDVSAEIDRRAAV